MFNTNVELNELSFVIYRNGIDISNKLILQYLKIKCCKYYTLYNHCKNTVVQFLTETYLK